MVKITNAVLSACRKSPFCLRMRAKSLFCLGLKVTAPTLPRQRTLLSSQVCKRHLAVLALRNATAYALRNATAYALRNATAAPYATRPCALRNATVRLTQRDGCALRNATAAPYATRRCALRNATVRAARMLRRTPKTGVFRRSCTLMLPCEIKAHSSAQDLPVRKGYSARGNFILPAQPPARFSVYNR